MDTKESGAYGAAHPTTEEEAPHFCCDGWVFLGYIVPMPDGTEEEVTEAVPCRRCAQLGSAGASR